MNIPDEAVEAANKAVYREFKGLIRPALVKVALEAAAPHLIARGWAEGFDRGFYDPLAGGDRDASESAAVNPYRAGAE